MRTLILADAGDMTAAAVAARLRARHGPESARLVWMHELIAAPFIAHTVDHAGAAARFRLRDGSEVDLQAFDAVFNRLRFVQAPRFWRSAPHDREYALSELFALLTSSLATLTCPVVNPATASNLSGVAWHTLDWHRLCGSIGIATPRLKATSRHSRADGDGLTPCDDPVRGSIVYERAPGAEWGWWREPLVDVESLLVVGDGVVGSPSRTVADAATRLVRAAGLRLARCVFARRAMAPHEPVFVDIDQYPDLTASTGAGAKEAADALALLVALFGGAPEAVAT